MKIGLFLIFYNNKEEINRLIESIPKDAIDVVIAIDGIFRYIHEKYPNLPELSNDGSRQLLVNSEKFLTCLVDKSKSTEYEKRNAYLEICDKFDIDVGIVTDTDEYFIYEKGVEPIEAWNRFRKNLEIQMIQKTHHNCYGIRYFEGDADTYKPRIWIRPNNMRYIKGSHYHYADVVREAQDIEYFNRMGSTYCQHAASIIKPVILTHDHSLRDQEYLERRKQYQQYLVAYEELVQSGKYSEQECDRMAKAKPKEDFEPTYDKK